MAEPALALRDHPQIIDLISVLEQSGLQKQKEEVQALVGYIDGMEEKLSQMMDEMKEMRLEVGKLHDKGIRARCSSFWGRQREKSTRSNLWFPRQRKISFHLQSRWCRPSGKKGALPCAVRPSPAHPFSSFPDGRGLCPCRQRHGTVFRKAGCHAGRIAPGGRPHQKRRACPCGEGIPGKARNYLRIRVYLPSCASCFCCAVKRVLTWITIFPAPWSGSAAGAHP